MVLRGKTHIEDISKKPDAKTQDRKIEANFQRLCSYAGNSHAFDKSFGIFSVYNKAKNGPIINSHQNEKAQAPSAHCGGILRRSEAHGILCLTSLGPR
jgi:hypothetical protein